MKEKINRPDAIQSRGTAFQLKISQGFLYYCISCENLYEVCKSVSKFMSKRFVYKIFGLTKIKLRLWNTF